MDQEREPPLESLVSGRQTSPTRSLRREERSPPRSAGREPSPMNHRQPHYAPDPAVEELESDDSSHDDDDLEERMTRPIPPPSPTPVHRTTSWKSAVSPTAKLMPSHTARTAEESPTSSAASPAERRRQRHLHQAASVSTSVVSSKASSQDPPTGHGQQGRLALPATPMAQESTAAPMVMASPAASSLATEPRSNAHALITAATNNKNDKNKVKARSELNQVLPPRQVMTTTTTTTTETTAPPAVPKQKQQQRQPVATSSRQQQQRQQRESKRAPPKAKEQARDSKRAPPKAKSVPPAVVKNNSNKTTTTEESKKKKGFFGRMFKRGGSKRGNLREEEEELNVVQEVSIPSQSESRSSDREEVVPPQPAPVPVPAAFVDEQGFATTALPKDEHDPQLASHPQHQPELAFMNDDVSTLTNPTLHSDSRRAAMKARMDPTESGPQDASINEPMGHYFKFDTVLDQQDSQEETVPTIAADPSVDMSRGSIDPFEQPFFQPKGAEPTPTNESANHNNQKSGRAPTPQGMNMNASPMVGVSSTTKSMNSSVKKRLARHNQLSVKTTIGSTPPDMHADPFGDDLTQHGHAFQDPSPRGYQTPEALNFPDPVGESPLHKHERGPAGLVEGQADMAPDPPLFIASMPDEDDEDDTEKNPDDEDLLILETTTSADQFSTFGHMGAIPATSSQLSPSSGAFPTASLPSPASLPKNRRGMPPRLPPSPSVGVVPRSQQPKPSFDEFIYGKEETDDATAVTTSSTNHRRKPRPEDIMTRRSHSAANAEPAVESPANASVSSVYDADSGEKIDAASLNKAKSPTKSGGGEDEESSPSPASKAANKKLMISSMARMNAKAVAYLHTLNGEPSPRNAWHKTSPEEFASPAAASKKGRDSLASVATDAASTPGSRGEDKQFFRAYSGKFKGRKLTSKVPTPRAKKEVRFNSQVSHSKQPMTPRTVKAMPMSRDISMTDEVVSMGFAAFRYRREMDIVSGKCERVVPVPKPSASNARAPSPDPEPLDPIQRAGRRLLSKAAVPIQSMGRRFLAQQEAVDRMWALIEIQSYMRRWRAEAHLLACSLASVTIQRMIRGHLAKVQLRETKAAAVHIQRVVRGHLAQAWAFETVYSIITIQALARRFLVQLGVSDQIFAATLFQSSYRGYVQRKSYVQERAASTRVQTFWRTHSERLRYKCALVDIIIAQSVVRKWAAVREANNRRNRLEYSSCVLIQKTWRRHWGVDSYEKYRAARTIQSAWRGFQGYTDYIFYLVDILLVQRVSRRWLAIKEANRRRKYNAATKIQTVWRTHHARMGLYQDLADIIRVQSMARLYLAHAAVYQRKIEVYEEDEAATKIQAAWRGFWSYSHFVIMQFEVTKVQAAMRGVLTRRQQQFRLGCCILIQAAARRYLARQSVDELLIERAFVASKALEMRERLSAERIQFWWSVVQECQKEKKAALVIERFFIMVKEEVEREIMRQEKRKQEKREKRRHRKKHNKDDDRMLELAYSASQSTMGTPMSVAGSSFSVNALTPANAKRPSSSKSGISMQMKSPAGGSVRHRSSSPSMDMVMRHEQGDVIRHKDVLIGDTKNAPALSSRRSATSRPAKSSQPSPHNGSLQLEFSKSEAESISSGKIPMRSKLDKKGSAPPFNSRSTKSTDNINKYMNMYGIKSGASTRSSAAPGSSKASSHFFADEDDEIMTPVAKKQPPANRAKTPTPPSGSIRGLNVTTDDSSEYQKALLAAAKASIGKPKPSQMSPSPRHGSMMVMDRFQRESDQKEPTTPSVAESDESSFLAGEQFGMI